MNDDRKRLSTVLLTLMMSGLKESAWSSGTVKSEEKSSYAEVFSESGKVLEVYGEQEAGAELIHAMKPVADRDIYRLMD